MLTLLSSVFEMTLQLMPFNADNYAASLMQIIFLLVLDVNDKTLIKKLKQIYADYVFRKKMLEIEQK